MDPVGKLVKPPAYIVGERKEWFVSEEDDCPGFAIFVRTDVSNAEQAWLNAQHREILDYQVGEWAGLAAEARDLAHSPRARELALIAPYVYDWNARGILDATGELADVPPPAIAGAAAWEAVLEPEREFCTRVVLNGYLYLGKAMRLRRRSPATGDPSVEDQTLPATPPRRKSSRRKT